MAIKRITTARDMTALADELGVRHDWHEPDEQGVTAEVLGYSFDNAGHWGEAAQERGTLSMEKFVRIFLDGTPWADVNLATLMSWAAAKGRSSRLSDMTKAQSDDTDLVERVRRLEVQVSDMEEQMDSFQVKGRG